MQKDTRKRGTKSRQQAAKKSAGQKVGGAQLNGMASTLELNFKGLFVFCFKKDWSACQLGTLSTAPIHQLQVTITKEKEGEKPGATTFFVNPVAARQIESIELITEGGKSGLTKPTAAGKFDRTDLKSVGEHDLRWILDYETELHGEELKLRSGILKPTILVTSGEFSVGEVDNVFCYVIQGGKLVRELGYVAKSVRAMLNVQSGKMVGLRIKKTGSSAAIEFPLWAMEAGCKYKIELTNSRPEEFDQPKSIEQSPIEKILDPLRETIRDLIRKEYKLPSDMLYYYHLIDKHADEHFDFVATKDKKIAAEMLGFPPAECYPIVLGKSSGLP